NGSTSSAAFLSSSPSSCRKASSGCRNNCVAGKAVCTASAMAPLPLAPRKPCPPLPRPPLQSNDPPMSQRPLILALEGVTKTFDGFKAINDLNFYLNEGELRVIIGPNGAGKSTMLDLVTGRTRPDRGTIEYGKDTDLTALNEYQINRLGVGRKFQTPSVYIDHTVF